jgi:hypothetical protein
VGLHDGRFLDPRDRLLDLAGRAHEDAGEAHRRLAGAANVQHLGPARRPVEQVHHVVQTGREHMDVLAVDRRDEAAVQPLVQRQHELVGAVLLVLDRADQLRLAPRLGEQIAQ